MEPAHTATSGKARPQCESRPLQALRALVSFARHGTVRQAAEELNLTRSAVSHQLRMLERDLDFHMLDRQVARGSNLPRKAAPMPMMSVRRFWRFWLGGAQHWTRGGGQSDCQLRPRLRLELALQQDRALYFGLS